ncbi:Nucleotide sugar epimerase [Planctomycetales bacterium 10988]|nr:Nucleotide sugar epimerase [Planctomycetales bacterium 10988]
MAIGTTPKKREGTPYLVTGCAGFLGAAVSEALLNAGNQVTGVDFFPPNDLIRPLKTWRLRQLNLSENFTFWEQDLRHAAQVTEGFANRAKLLSPEPPWQAILHFAALPGVRASWDAPGSYHETNVEVTRHLLQLAQTYDIPRFLFASSSTVYGDLKEELFAEHLPLGKPMSPYAASKQQAEQLVLEAISSSNMSGTILRYFSLYGPGGRPDMVIWRWMEALVTQKPLALFGSGEQERCFTFITDAVRGTLAALDHEASELFNLGNPRSVRLLDLLRLLEHLTEQKAVLQSHPSHPAETSLSKVDPTKAERVLGWKPKVELEEGLYKTFTWWKHFRQSPGQDFLVDD